MQDALQTTALAHLARLEISAQRAALFSVQLDGVLGYVSQLQSNLVNQPKTEQPLGTPLAQDTVRGDNDPLNVERAALFSALPLTNNNLIKVRAVL